MDTSALTAQPLSSNDGFAASGGDARTADVFGTPASGEMVNRVCPLCGKDEAVACLTAGDTIFGFPGVFHVVRCHSCGMKYTNPQVAPHDLGGFYPPTYAAHAADRAIRQRISRRSRDPWDRLPPMGQKQLLDVGCGSGAFLLRRQREGWNVFGVEPSDEAAEAARMHGLDVATGVIPGIDLTGRQFEVITLLGVLGVVPQPLLTLSTLRPLLVRGGTLIVTAHNTDSAAAGLFGADWQGWDLPRHQNHFTPGTLTSMIERAGFGSIELRWKRRTSRWRHAARRRAAQTGELRWKMMARSRNLCSAAAMAMSRGPRSDEIIAIAQG